MALENLSSEFSKSPSEPAAANHSVSKTPRNSIVSFDIAEFAVFPNIEMLSWHLWLSPHLVLKSPKVSVGSSSIIRERMHLDVCAALSHGGVLATTIP